jgi:transposase
MDAYSEDLRQKIVEAVQQRRMSKSEAARAFSVSRSSVKRYVKAVCEGRSLTPGKALGKKPKLDEKARRLLEADIEERPFAKLTNRREYLKKVAGVTVSESTLSRVIRQMSFDRKRTLGASEQDEFLRAAFRVMVISSIEPERLVFLRMSARRIPRWHPFTGERERASGLL